MRYLLLSVLVVCVIGVMIPSAFAETYTVESAQGSSLVDCAPNNCFIPFLLHIEIGDTVIFQNNDNASHTFTSGTATDGSYGIWDSSMVQTGGSYTVTFDTEAEYPYFCMLHPWAQGTIIVGEGGENSYEKSVREAEEAAAVEAEKAEAAAVEAEKAAEKAAKLLLPDIYTLHDVSYVSTSTPNSGEIPYIEHLNAFVKEEEVYATIMIWKFLPSQDVHEISTKMSDAWGLYVEVDLTPNSSCVYGNLRDTPVFLCSQDDAIVYTAGTGINFKKYTKEVLNNLKGIPTTTITQSAFGESDILTKAKAYEHYGLLKEASIHYGMFLESCGDDCGQISQSSSLTYAGLKESIDFRLSSDKDYFEHPDVRRNIIISNDAVYNARIGNYHDVLEHYDTIRWCSGCNGADYFRSAGELLMIYRALDAIGENEKALEVVEQLIPTFEKMTQGWDSKSSATTMADLYTSKMISLYKLGEYQDILDYLGSGYVVLGSIFDGDPYWNGKVRVSTKIMEGAVYEKMGNMEKAQESYTKAREYEHRDLGYGTSTIIFDEQQFYKYITKFFLKVEDFTLAEKYIQKITDSDTKKELLEIIEYFEIVKPILRQQPASLPPPIIEEVSVKQQTTSEPDLELEPISEPTQSSEGCGAGTVLVNGVCQLTPTQSKTSSMSIEPLYIIIVVVGIGGVIGAIAAAKRGSKTPKPVKQKPKEEPKKEAPKEEPKKKETSAFCENCGTPLKPTAKFCGGCGTPVS